MTSTSNKYLVGLIITSKELDDTIYSSFEKFQFNHNDTKDAYKRRI